MSKFLLVLSGMAKGVFTRPILSADTVTAVNGKLDKFSDTSDTTIYRNP